jgi:hypothetical protein
MKFFFSYAVGANAFIYTACFYYGGHPYLAAVSGATCIVATVTNFEQYKKLSKRLKDSDVKDA